MRALFIALLVGIVSGGPLSAQEDKKTDDLKPADPDTGESTVEESTLGVLPNPFEKTGIKFAVTYIGEVLGNPSGGQKRGAVYEDRFNFAVDIDFEKLWGLSSWPYMPTSFRSTAAVSREGVCSTIWWPAASRHCRRRGFMKSGSRRSGGRRLRCGRVN